MNSITVELEDFGHHEHKTISFQKGINLLNGHSGSGKTTIARAIVYALFGDTQANKYARIGESKFKVRVNMDIGEELIEVLRTNKQKDVRIVRDGLEYCGEDATAQLRELFGADPNVMYLRQKGKQSFFEETESKRFELLQAIVDTEPWVAQFAKRLSDVLKNAKTMLDEATTTLVSLDTVRVQKPEMPRIELFHGVATESESALIECALDLKQDTARIRTELETSRQTISKLLTLKERCVKSTCARDASVSARDEAKVLLDAARVKSMELVHSQLWKNWYEHERSREKGVRRYETEMSAYEVAVGRYREAVSAFESASAQYAEDCEALKLVKKDLADEKNGLNTVENDEKDLTRRASRIEKAARAVQDYLKAAQSIDANAPSSEDVGAACTECDSLKEQLECIEQNLLCPCCSKRAYKRLHDNVLVHFTGAETIDASSTHLKQKLSTARTHKRALEDAVAEQRVRANTLTKCRESARELAQSLLDEFNDDAPQDMFAQLENMRADVLAEYDACRERARTIGKRIGEREQRAKDLQTRTSKRPVLTIKEPVAPTPVIKPPLETPPEPYLTNEAAIAQFTAALIAQKSAIDLENKIARTDVDIAQFERTWGTASMDADVVWVRKEFQMVCELISVPALESILKRVREICSALDTQLARNDESLGVLNEWIGYARALSAFTQWNEQVGAATTRRERAEHELKMYAELQGVFTRAKEEHLIYMLDSINELLDMYVNGFFEEKNFRLSFELDRTHKQNPSIKSIIQKDGHIMATVSGGEHDRLALATMLVFAELQNPALLILDESLAHLDSENVDRVCGFLAQRNTERVVVLVAHQVVEGMFANVVRIE